MASQIFTLEVKSLRLNWRLVLNVGRLVCPSTYKCLKERHEKKNDSDKHFLPKSPAKGPLSNGYKPEIDVTPELDANDAAYYQLLIGVLQWMVELGRVDICCEVLMMLSCLALP